MGSRPIRSELRGILLFRKGRRPMKITILNGNPDAGNELFDGYLQRLAGALEPGGHEVAALTLREMDIKQCIGCFDCWLKTPGVCVHQDDGPGVCRDMINSDLVLYASPVVMGFPSELLKRTVERTIPLLLPYFKFVEGEVRHKLRYDGFPRMGVLWERSGDTDDEDLEIVNEIFEQVAQEFSGTLSVNESTNTPAEEVANAISGL